MKKNEIIYYGYGFGGLPRLFPVSPGGFAPYIAVKQGSNWFTLKDGGKLEPLGDREDRKDYNAAVREKVWLPFKDNPFKK